MAVKFRAVALASCFAIGSRVSVSAESFTTNIFSGVSTNVTGAYIVGDTGSFNYLEINSGGMLTSGGGIVGNKLAASNNSVLVTGTNSVWSALSGFFFGENGANNSVVVSNGGILNSGADSIVGDGTRASNNLVLVAGSNSVWNNRGSLWIGYQGSGNRLRIEDGAQVLSNNFVWLGTQLSTNNALIVTGAGSQLMNSGTFLMGAGGPSNQLVVSAGARFMSAGATINGAANVVAVTGSNTVWSNSGNLEVGHAIGPNNQITISNGAIFSNSAVFVGYSAASSNNSVIVDGAGALWHNDGFFWGENSPNNTLTVTNGGKIETAGAVIGDGRTANSNRMVVTGTNTVWSNSGTLLIGWNGSGNRLQIEDGAQALSNSFVWLGTAISVSNILIVTGSNSRLMNSGSFLMGAGGPANNLTVSSGATFTCGGAFVDGSNNAVTITGSNTVWSNSGSLQFGRYGANSVLSISDGAVVSNADAYIGTNSPGNLVVVSGAKSIWNTASVTIGTGSSGNQLIISNGAVLNGGSMTIGVDGPGNAVVLTGSNTVCNSGAVVVGVGSSVIAKFNMLSIQDGAQLSLNNSSATISASGFGNQAVVTGPGSQWTGIDTLTVGPSDMMCQFTISNGATVQAAQMVVGKILNGSSNQVSILNGGTLVVTNGSGTAPLVLTQTATITLNAGTLIGNSILISNFCRITGCGTIVGNIKNLGTLAVNCPGGTLTILGAVTNYATILATNDADVEFLGPVVNNGTIDVVNGWAHFQGGLINQGVYRDAGSVLRITSLNANGGDIVLGFLAVSNKSYAVKYTDDLTAGTWLVSTNITGSGVATQIIDPGAAVLTQRFYRVHLSLP